ncbi:MAG: acyl--CoA ligase [Candidatus Tectomicrobia bacterium]|uniref:Acyl--CoA ligase n=1 Tax=Tectimicrobiota bacterium TaxID=2528274 RepID=A0A932CPP9_UNCTE|nr:acyl--CoA ligase [Candidatus Tectomicrobia bacterium]
MGSHDILLMGATLKQHARRYPHKTAVIFEEKGLTYQQFNGRVDRLAQSLLSLGVSPGDKIALLALNCPEVLEVYLASAKVGAVAVPLNGEIKDEEIRYILDHSDSRVLVLGKEFQEKAAFLRAKVAKVEAYLALGEGPVREGLLSYERLLAEAPEREPEGILSEAQPGMIFYTSGSKGFPKGVVRSHRANVLAYLYGAIEFGLTERDICLSTCPLHRAGSALISLMPLYLGATVCLLRGFSPARALQVIQHHRVTFSLMSPEMFDALRMLSETGVKGTDVSSLRTLVSSMSPLLTRTKEWILDFFGGVQLYEAYEATELGFCTMLKPEDQRRKVRCVGQPALGCEVMILDEKGRVVSASEAGELFTRGPCLFSGYYKDPQAMADNSHEGWFSVGDIMCRDDEGYYYIVERRPDRVCVDDSEIYPSEIHRILMSHPQVREAAIFPMSSGKWGEAFQALVVLKEGEAVTQEELMAYCQERLSTFKRPHAITFVEELPRHHSGKMLKRTFREKYWREQEGMPSRSIQKEAAEFREKGLSG